MSTITANATLNTEWYRKYSDGWIEQGGCVKTSFSSRGSVSFTFPVAFTSTPVSIDTTPIFPKTGDQLGFELCVTSLTATGATVMYDFTTGSGNIQGFYWRVKGK